MRIALAALLLVTLGACATPPPPGPKPCSPEWQAERKEVAFTGFAARHRGQLDTMKSLADGFASGESKPSKENKVAALQLAFVGVGMLKLAGQFSDETAKPVRYDLGKCGEPPATGMLFADMLRQEKFPPAAAAAVEQFSLWMSIGN